MIALRECELSPGARENECGIEDRMNDLDNHRRREFLKLAAVGGPALAAAATSTAGAKPGPNRATVGGYRSTGKLAFLGTRGREIIEAQGLGNKSFCPKFL